MEHCALIREVCRSHLGGHWTQASDDQITLEVMGKGCSNKMITASLQLEQGAQIEKVIVRIYGDNLSDNETLMRDVVLNSYLGYTGKAPVIRALFKEGRIEQFIPCTTIGREDFALQYKKIAGLMVNIHDIQSMPFSKLPGLEAHLRSYLSKIPGEQALYWGPEVEWLTSVIQSLPLEVTLCHNDVNMLNVLIPNSGAEPILIDYEFSQYNYPTFDIANYFCERSVDWMVDEEPFFKRQDAWFPSEEEMLVFLKEYTSQRVSSVRLSADIMLQQVKVMVLASHMLWAMWADAVEGTENIDMTVYRDCRKNSYQADKVKYLDQINEMLRATVSDSKGSNEMLHGTNNGINGTGTSSIANNTISTNGSSNDSTVHRVHNSASR